MNITWPAVTALAILALFARFVILVVASLVTGHRQQREREVRNRRRLRETTVTHLRGTETVLGGADAPEAGKSHHRRGASPAEDRTAPVWGTRGRRMSNIITITGWVATEPELRLTPSGAAVLNFSLPENHGYKDQHTGEWKQTGTTWRAVSLWGSDAEFAAENIRKGDLVQVTGREVLETFQRKDGTDGFKLSFKAFQVAKVLKAPKRQDGYQDQQPRQSQQRQSEQADPWGQQSGGNYDWGQPAGDTPPF